MKDLKPVQSSKTIYRVKSSCQKLKKEESHYYKRAMLNAFHEKWLS